MMIVRCALSNVSCYSSQLSIKHSSIKTLATTCCIQKVKSSSDWFKRHQKDQYVKRAQKDNYRARSAYKLLEIADQHQLLTPGQCVVECGGAPGAWTQVIADRVGSEGLVVSCDLLDFSPVPGVNILPFTDFTAKDSQEKILHLLGSKKVDVVLSDMSPNLSGNKSFDHDQICNLVYSVIRFALPVSSPNAHLLMKVFAGNKLNKLSADLSRFYGSVCHLKPGASRRESSELYILASNFRGIKRSDQC